MIKLIVVTTGSALFFTSCSNKIPEANLVTNQVLVKHRANQSWWRQLNETSLNQDVSAAFKENPGLESVALRVGQADAAVAATKASTLPRVNLGFGYQEGRRKEVDFGPYDLVPWESQAGLSWEVDLSGKLKSAKNAAVENRNAAVWDIYSARLMLASRIAKTRMNLIRLNADISNLEALLASQRRTLENSSDRSNAGLIPDAAKYTEKAEVEKITRAKQDLQRLRDLTVVQLRTLRGGSQPQNIGSAKFPKPPRLASRPLNSLLSSHPSILAAEARVRAAFQLQQSAQLDLLPSFQINLLASGAQRNLAERFRIWTLKAVHIDKQISSLQKVTTFIDEAAARGELSPLDSAQTKLEIQTLSIKKKQLAEERSLLTTRLKQYIGMPASKPLNLSGSLPSLSVPSRSLSLSDRADFRAKALEFQHSKSNILLEKSKRYDDVEVSVLGALGREEDAPEGLENEGRIGVGLSIPLPFYDKNEGNIAAANAKAQRSILERGALASEIRLQVATHKQEMQAWLARNASVRNELLPLAEKTSADLEAAYKNGQGDFTSFLKSKTQELALRTSLIDNNLKFHQARVKYFAALGKSKSAF